MRSNRTKIASNGKWVVLLFFSALILLTWQCASIQQPQGGPKDSIPPTILEETPANLTRNFQAEKIVIEFDEFIKLSNPFKEISVSPDLDQPINPRVKRKILKLHFPIPWKRTRPTPSTSGKRSATSMKAIRYLITVTCFPPAMSSIPCPSQEK